VVATLLVVFLLPLMAAAALGVRLSSRGPVFFRQRRVGQHGREFEMLKFRTFPVGHVDSEQALPLEECPLAFGRFLRRTSIDELPQLFNVIKGEMSLVGPRPERPHFAAPLSAEVPGYVDRHRFPVGITGLAQVNGLWGVGNIEERVRFDNDYIDQWSLGLDLKILLRTIPEVFVKARVR
jgi:lipopolysaccharide/colanic/teichoic acid biosynthesis glycosyltransferase